MKALERMIAALKRLPGIGPKQAERISNYLLRAPVSEIENLLTAMREGKARTRLCAQCFNYSEHEICLMCQDESRDQGLLCVVEDPQDVKAVERSKGFRGLYHVLHGRLSPLEGVGPDSIRIKELLERIKKSRVPIREAILATDSDTEGDATALYLSQVLRECGLKITRLAQGIPLGGDLDYIDERTLQHALNGRREI